jgi:hypothetical protein
MSSHAEEKGHWEHKKASEYLLCPGKTDHGLQKELAHPRNKKRITKMATLVVGRMPNEKCK